MQLRPSPGLGVLESLLDQLGPVLNGCGHVSNMDEVEGLLKSPGLLRIVYFELDVCWYP